MSTKRERPLSNPLQIRQGALLVFAHARQGTHDPETVDTHGNGNRPPRCSRDLHLARLTGFEPTTFGSGAWLDEYHGVTRNALQYLQIRMITGEIHFSFTM